MLPPFSQDNRRNRDIQRDSRYHIARFFIYIFLRNFTQVEKALIFAAAANVANSTRENDQTLLTLLINDSIYRGEAALNFIKCMLLRSQSEILYDKIEQVSILRVKRISTNCKPNSAFEYEYVPMYKPRLVGVGETVNVITVNF